MQEIFQHLPWFLQIPLFALSFGAVGGAFVWLLNRFLTVRIAVSVLFIGAVGWYFLFSEPEGSRSLNVGDTVLHEDEIN